MYSICKWWKSKIFHRIPAQFALCHLPPKASKYFITMIQYCSIMDSYAKLCTSQILQPPLDYNTMQLEKLNKF